MAKGFEENHVQGAWRDTRERQDVGQFEGGCVQPVLLSSRDACHGFPLEPLDIPRYDMVVYLVNTGLTIGKPAAGHHRRTPKHRNHPFPRALSSALRLVASPAPKASKGDPRAGSKLVQTGNAYLSLGRLCKSP